MVSDDLAVRDSVKDVIESVGMKAKMFESLHMYRSKVERQSRGCLIFDAHNVNLSEGDQRSMLEDVCTVMSVILITDRGDVATAVCGMKSGAVDIVQKPYQENRLLDSVNNAINAQSLS